MTGVQTCALPIWGLEKQKAGVKDPAELKLRAVTTLVKHVLK